MTRTLARPAGAPAEHDNASAFPGCKVAAADGGPIARVVAASLLTAVFGAAALTLGVFGGAPEHVITGSALLAFAVSWALLAVLSSRLTSPRSVGPGCPPPRWPSSASGWWCSRPATTR